MILTILQIISVFNIRECHLHCINKNGKFFTSEYGKHCQIFHMDPKKVYPPPNIPNLFQCSRDIYISTYHTPESCCVTKTKPCREVCL